MTALERVQQILDTAVKDITNIGPHGPFWRGLSRDEFVVAQVFGLPILALNNPDDSLLVKALEGREPFGTDLTPPTPGASFRRMPGGLPPVEEDDIQFIRQWIADGCPENSGPDLVDLVDETDGGPVAGEQHNAFWRDFDNWAMFQASAEVQSAIGQVFSIHSAWRIFANSQLAADEQSFEAAINTATAKQAVELLAARQQETIAAHYGSPLPLLTLLDVFQRFGADTLPEDPLRPIAPRHNMNGAGMWFIWASFDEACRRLGIAPEFWVAHQRALLVGLLNDGLFRGRFTVNDFTNHESSKEKIREFAQQVANDELNQEIARRFRDSGLNT